ncbi:hypothetical protein V5N11_034777 [Cardamine amara subsp. amara]|uniref:Uncharacterized protein n=1 Tax=Cardamine amara subsp. amara TaxID=228776 RepID=A0ABD1B734_CARAN
MQGLTTSIDRVSLTFPVPRNQSTHLKKPTRMCFSGSASFPKSRIFSSQIVPLPESAANHFASSSNHIFAHDRRLTKRVSASNDESCCGC